MIDYKIKYQYRNISYNHITKQNFPFGQCNVKHYIKNSIKISLFQILSIKYNKGYIN
jgi:hypothetical protein